MPEITKEVLISNVEGLTEEQAKPILEMIGNRIGEIHGQYDQDISSVTGQQKPQGVKTYTWLKDVLSEYKNKKPDESLQSELEKIKSERAELQKKLEAGLKDDSALDGYKQQINDYKTQVEQLQAKIEEDKTTYQKELDKTKFLNEVNKVRGQLKFKPEIPESIRETVIDSTVQRLMQLQRDQIDDGKGGQMTVFRDETGKVLRNPENKLDPYSISDLLKKELKDVIDTGRKQSGAGTKPSEGGSQNGVINLDAKTQVEADKQIREHLLQKGIAVTDPKHAQQAQELRKELKVADLPTR